MVEGAYQPPADFDDYWGDVQTELAATPARPEIEPIPIRETEFARLYGVRISGIEAYRLFGYLSIPKGDGSFPAIYWGPKYGSVLEVIPQGTAAEIRSRFVTFSLAGRGMRNSDKPFAAMFPGLLTERIESADTYVFRSIVADALRGMEFLASRPEVDGSSTVAIGNDVSLQTAALGGHASHLVCTPSIFFDSLAFAARTTAYPLEEYNDYLRFRPSTADAIAHTLGYFDLRGFAPAVEATTLLMAGPPGTLLGPESLEPLRSRISGEAAVHASQQSSYRDGVFAEEWVASQLGFDSALLPAHWS